MTRNILEEFEQALEEIRAANLPEFERRISTLEKLHKDLREQLAPLLALLRTKGER